MKLYVYLFLSFSVLSYSQGLKGILANRSNDGPIIVELVGSEPGAHESTYVASDGSFEFRQIPHSLGALTLRVLNAYNQPIYSQTITSNSGLAGPIEVRIPTPKVDRPSSGTVSIATLSHVIPKQARKKYEAAEKAAEKKDYEKSIALLEEAVKLDPDFMAAWNNLGARHLRLHHYKDSEAAFIKAVQLDPANTQALANLGLAFLYCGRVVEAMTAAQSALRIERDSKPAMYVLGMGYANLRQWDLAIPLLKEVQPLYPSVSLALERIQMSMAKR